VQFGVLAAYAVILVAALLLERRRTETALLRARGAGTGHLASMAFGEGLLVVVPAVLAAPWLAVLLVQAVRLNPAMEGVGLAAPLPGPTTFAVAALAGVFALVALTIPTLVSAVDISGVAPRLAARPVARCPSGWASTSRSSSWRPSRCSSSGCTGRRSPATPVVRSARTRCSSPRPRSACSAAPSSRSG
jgi:hypothetical protein